MDFCEFDKYAVKSYCAVHDEPESKNLGDVTKVDGNKLPYADLMVWGFPCGLAGSKVKTINGYKNIEEITTDDYVLTHKNRYNKVYEIMDRVSDHYYKIKYSGNYYLYLTEEHPLFVWRNGEMQWIKVKDLTISDYISVNVNTKNENKYNLTENECWLLGRYCADGYCEKDRNYQVGFSIGTNKKNEFLSHISQMEFSETHKNRNCQDIRVKDIELTELCKHFGNGAKNKVIPQFIIDLPSQLLQSFFNGYIAGDGYIRRYGQTIMWTTVSEKMMLGINDIVVKLYDKLPTVTVRKDNRKATFNDSYACQISLGKNRFQFGGFDKLFIRVKDIIRVEEETPVYNFSVTDDESYTISNLIVHNCTDISVAGLVKGFIDKEGKQTRSGLYYEGLRILKETMPKYSIIENVKNLVGKKFKEQFGTILEDIRLLGYTNYWKVLNAKDFGIPQNRERVFIISIRNDVDNGLFEFPQTFDNGLRLKNFLEDKVDVKYYLPQEKTDKLIETLGKDITNEKTISFTRKKIIRETDICNTLQAAGPSRGLGDNNPITGVCTPYLEAKIVAQRGRYVDNKTEQQFEPRKDDLTNTLTTVQKDNLLLENKCVQLGNLIQPGYHESCNRVYSPDGIARTLMGGGGNLNDKAGQYLINYRVRRLTPLECWKLMGFTNKDFQKAQDVGISDSQLYKQAGNSIVTNVLKEIFINLFDN